jgi:hypothetical protein
MGEMLDIAYNAGHFRTKSHTIALPDDLLPPKVFVEWALSKGWDIPEALKPLTDAAEDKDLFDWIKAPDGTECPELLHILITAFRKGWAGKNNAKQVMKNLEKEYKNLNKAKREKLAYILNLNNSNY